MRRFRPPLRWLPRALFVAFMGSSAQATLHDVPGDFPSIGAAIEAAGVGDTVQVAPGTWTENLSLGGKGLTLMGTAPTDPRIVAQTIVDGSADAASTIWVGGASLPVRISGLTIRGGAGNEVHDPYFRRLGGGVLCESGLLSITHCRLVGNGINRSKVVGSGIYVGADAELSVDATLLANNNADKGGAIAVEEGQLELTRSRVLDNTANNGGGVYLAKGGILNASESAFRRNKGQAISCLDGSETRLERCDLTNNQGGYSGAVYSTAYFEMVGGSLNDNVANSDGGALKVFAPGTARLEGVVVARNWALRDGGAIRVSGGGLELERCTLVMNGGGTAVIQLYSESAWASIQNSIIWRNGPFVPLYEDLGSIAVSYSDVEGGYPGEGNIDADPRFCTLPCGDLNVSIAKNSPCVGAGRAGGNLGAGPVACDVGFEPDPVTREVPGDYPTIQSALDAACDGDTVRVQPGTWQECINFGGKAIVLTGIAPEDSAVVQESVLLGAGESVVRITQGEPEGTEIRGLRIRGGNSTDYGECIGSVGGGFMLSNADVAIRHCVIDSNHALTPGMYYRGKGGALWANQTRLRVSDCLIERNKAQDYGGGFALWDSDVRLVGCEFRDNSVGGYGYKNPGGAGGALAIVGGTSHLLACHIVDNFASAGRGGGIRILSGAQVTLDNCLLTRNSADPHCYFEYYPRGGALAVDGESAVNLRFSVVTKNAAASSSGGGIAVLEPATLNTRGAVIWSNATGGYFTTRDLYTWSPDAIQFSYSLVPPDQLSPTNILGPPNFISWQNHDYLLSPGQWGADKAILPRSPCIDAGPPDLQDGVIWPPAYNNESRSDIGLYGGPGGVLWGF